MDRRNFLKASGWTLLGLAAAETIPGCAKLGDRDSLPGDLKKGFPSLKGLKVFWGDVHNHCNVTYGHGDLSDALAAAEQQLDFVSVTPHALWPDIPGENDPRLNWVIGYHTEAFRRLRAGGYDKYLAAVRAANRPGEFLTFPSYECHSMEHGDHVALFHGFDAPLVTAEVTTADGTVTLTYAIGTDGYYMMVSGDSSVYTVDGQTVQALCLTARQLKADT